MGSSSYHYTMKNKYRSEINTYGRWLTQLRSMRSDITNYPVTTKSIKNVCIAVKKCAGNVESGLKGENMYAMNIQFLWKMQEQEPLSDTDMRTAYDAVSAEINRVTLLKREAEKNYAYHKQKHEEALKREIKDKLGFST